MGIRKLKVFLCGIGMEWNSCIRFSGGLEDVDSLGADY